MPKKKTKSKAKAKQQTTTQTHSSNGVVLQITPEDLQNIIAYALLQAEEQRKQIEKDKQEQEKQKWKEEVGYKDYSKSNSRFAKVSGALNESMCGFKLLFMPSKKIKGYKTISASLGMGLSNNYLFACWLSFLLAFSIVLVTVGMLISNFLPWYIGLLLFILAVCFIYNGLKNRLAYYEVTYIKDDNLILNLLASHNSRISIMIAFISVVIAIIALLKDVIYELF